MVGGRAAARPLAWVIIAIRESHMKLHRSVSVIVLAALILAAVVGLVLTARAPKPNSKSNGAALPEEWVDQHPLQTARSLAQLASTDDERQFADDAERIADHEVDVAFASALRAASRQPVAKKSAAMEQRIDRAQARVKQLQAKTKDLTAQAAKAKGASLTEVQQQQTMTAAQLDLAQDELADAQQDMARASGDAYSEIQRAWQEHEQTQHANGATRLAAGSAASASLSQNSLIARWSHWSSLASEGRQIAAARAYVLNKASILTGRHNALDQAVAQGQAQKQKLDQESASLLAASRAVSRPAAHESLQARQQQISQQKDQQAKIAASTLALMRVMSEDEVSMAAFDHRIQDLQSLATVYAQWGGVVAARGRTALHRLIRSTLWILLALLIALIAGRVVTSVFERSHLERKQRATLHGVVQFVIQALATLVILLVLFGSPNHVFTVLGLAGAGLTVALKDFVVAFCGWFVLMGRNGIRVGDWVEINGVRGEVTEIGLLRTQLLETGNWTEAGHPTGRQVAFLNSYAVEGYFFNFSTAGQWMWDELPVLIPKDEDPYPVIEQIRAVVAKETEASVRQAEEEWRHAAHHSAFRSMPAKPDITMTPGDSGVKLSIRYITRASERYEVRARLSRALVKLLRHGEKLLPDPAAVEPGLPPAADSSNGNQPPSEGTLAKAEDKG